MMGIGDFGLGVLASLFANKIDSFLKPMKRQPPHLQPEITHSHSIFSPPAPSKRKFKTFDAWNDMEKLLKVVNTPLISILIENEPSTNYRLPSMILESKATGEWFVFSRGRMAFEGMGGGLINSHDIISKIKSANIPIGVWVVERAILDDLDNGRQL